MIEFFYYFSIVATIVCFCYVLSRTFWHLFFEDKAESQNNERSKVLVFDSFEREKEIRQAAAEHDWSMMMFRREEEIIRREQTKMREEKFQQIKDAVKSAIREIRKEDEDDKKEG